MRPLWLLVAALTVGVMGGLWWLSEPRPAPTQTLEQSVEVPPVAPLSVLPPAPVSSDTPHAP